MFPEASKGKTSSYIYIIACMYINGGIKAVLVVYVKDMLLQCLLVPLFRFV